MFILEISSDDNCSGPKIMVLEVHYFLADYKCDSDWSSHLEPKSSCLIDLAEKGLLGTQLRITCAVVKSE